MMPRQYDAAAVESIAEKIEQAGKPQAAQEYREAMRRALTHGDMAEKFRAHAWSIYHVAMRGKEGGK